MINHTRITVDDETRRVLDELSGHLAQTPPWAGRLTDDLQTEIRDATRGALAAPIKSIGQIDAQLVALQARIASITDTLAGLTGSAQTLDSRVGALTAVLDQQVRAVDVLAERSDEANKAAAAQMRTIADLRQQAQTMNDKADALRAIADGHERQLATLIDHAQKLDAATNALLGTHALLLDVQTAQAAQRDVLQTVLLRVDHLSKPWWKRLFGAVGDAR